MSAFFVKQPNGLYARFSTVIDCPTHKDLTREQARRVYLEGLVEDATMRIDDILDFPCSVEDMLESFQPNCMTVHEFNKFLKEIGATERWHSEDHD